MSSMEREHSQDRELVRHHGSSFSSMDRTIPMYVNLEPRVHSAPHSHATDLDVGGTVPTQIEPLRRCP